MNGGHATRSPAIDRRTYGGIPAVLLRRSASSTLAAATTGGYTQGLAWLALALSVAAYAWPGPAAGLADPCARDRPATYAPQTGTASLAGRVVNLEIGK